MTTTRYRGKRAVAGLLSAATAATIGVSACGASFARSGSSGAIPADSHLINVCELVPPSRVASVTGHRITRATPARLDSRPDPDTFDCSYSSSAGNDVRILVEATNSKAVFIANERGLSGGDVFSVTSLRGLGDKAGVSAIGLAVLSGSYNIVINAGRPGQFAGNRAGLLGLARNLTSALGSIPVKDGGS